MTTIATATQSKTGELPGGGSGSVVSDGLIEFSRVDDGKNLGHAAPPWFPNGSLPYFEQDLATFLLGRGPYVWLGFGWSGCTDSHPPLPLGW